MKKRFISILMAIVVCILFCGYPVSTTVFGAEDKVTVKFEDINSYLYNLSCDANGSKLPDVVVTYKDGACTVKNLPVLKHPKFGRTESYEYKKAGNAGVFYAKIWSEGSPGPYQSPSHYIVDTTRNPVVAKLIDNGHPKGDEFEGQWFPEDIIILSNGISAFLEYPSVILIQPDDKKRIKLEPTTPAGYGCTVFGVDYNVQSEQYALTYGLYPETNEWSKYHKERAGVALFDKEYRLVKQFMLKNLYCEPLMQNSNLGYFIGFKLCRFSIASNSLYAGGMIPRSLFENQDDESLDGFMWSENYKNNKTYLIEKYGAYEYYKISLKDGNYTGISEFPVELKQEIPFNIQYNKTGTYIYIKSGDEYKTLASLKDDYIAASYSVNLDGSVQVIFVSDAKTGKGIHPIAK